MKDTRVLSGNMLHVYALKVHPAILVLDSVGLQSQNAVKSHVFQQQLLERGIHKNDFLRASLVQQALESRVVLASLLKGTLQSLQKFKVCLEYT